MNVLCMRDPSTRFELCPERTFLLRLLLDVHRRLNSDQQTSTRIATRSRVQSANLPCIFPSSTLSTNFTPTSSPNNPTWALILLPGIPCHQLRTSSLPSRQLIINSSIWTRGFVDFHVTFKVGGIMRIPFQGATIPNLFSLLAGINT